MLKSVMISFLSIIGVFLTIFVLYLFTSNDPPNTNTSTTIVESTQDTDQQSTSVQTGEDEENESTETKLVRSTLKIISIN